MSPCAPPNGALLSFVKRSYVHSKVGGASLCVRVESVGADRGLMSCVHHGAIVRFTALGALCVPPAPRPLSSARPCTVTLGLPFPECHLVGITWSVAFSG